MSNVNPQFLKLVHNVDYFTIFEFSLRKLNCEAIFASFFFFFYFKPILFVPRLSEIKGRKTCRDFPIFRIAITGGKSQCAGDHSLNVSQEKVIRKKKFPDACDPSKTVR